MTYPIELSDSGFWVVWSLPIEATIGGEQRARGLECFESYDAAALVCTKRNRQVARDRGLADSSFFGASFTYDEFYSGEIERLEERRA
jgi:hypothetical protein